MRFRTRWLEDWTRERATKTGEDPGTGAPTTSTTSEAVQLQVSFNRSGLRVSEFLNYRDDTAGFALAEPGTLLPNDIISHPTKGRYRVLEEAPQNYGSWERVDLKAA